MESQNAPDRNTLIGYLQHDESAALYGEGILVDLESGEYLLRVEACEATRPGNWFHGPFKDRTQAMNYARYLANLGRSGIRRENALPMVWQGGSQGNPIGVIRLYQVTHPCPAISSVVAPQREGGTVMVTSAHREALRSGNPMKSAEYAGQGQQLSVPVVETMKKHNLQLVKRVPGGELMVTKY